MIERSTSPEETTKQLQALHSLKILDTHPEARFDRITRLAKRLFNVPFAILSLADLGRPDLSDSQVLDALETAAGLSADEAGAGGSHQVMILTDTREDARFSAIPATFGGVEIRFYAGCPVHAPDGSRMGALCLMDTVPRNLPSDDVDLFRDLGEMVNEELSSLSMATSDVLTKLANRRGFERIASHIVPIAQRLRVPLSLVQIDLDGFKQINDAGGHAAGDRALAAFARHLLKNFRRSDVVARLGGDEFCVLLSGADEREVRQSLQRLRLRLERDGAYRIGFSAGIARFDPSRHASVDDLLKDADQRMYEAKRHKRTSARTSALS